MYFDRMILIARYITASIATHCPAPTHFTPSGNSCGVIASMPGLCLPMRDWMFWCASQLL